MGFKYLRPNGLCALTILSLGGKGEETLLSKLERSSSVRGGKFEKESGLPCTDSTSSEDGESRGCWNILQKEKRKRKRGLRKSKKEKGKKERNGW